MVVCRAALIPVLVCFPTNWQCGRLGRHVTENANLAQKITAVFAYRPATIGYATPLLYSFAHSGSLAEARERQSSSRGWPPH
jgi:hypothetical protein